MTTIAQLDSVCGMSVAICPKCGMELEPEGVFAGDPFEDKGCSMRRRFAHVAALIAPLVLVAIGRMLLVHARHALLSADSKQETLGLRRLGHRRGRADRRSALAPVSRRSIPAPGASPCSMARADPDNTVEERFTQCVLKLSPRSK